MLLHSSLKTGHLPEILFLVLNSLEMLSTACRSTSSLNINIIYYYYYYYWCSVCHYFVYVFHFIKFVCLFFSLFLLLLPDFSWWIKIFIIIWPAIHYTHILQKNAGKMCRPIPICSLPVPRCYPTSLCRPWGFQWRWLQRGSDEVRRLVRQQIDRHASAVLLKHVVILTLPKDLASARRPRSTDRWPGRRTPRNRCLFCQASTRHRRTERGRAAKSLVSCNYTWSFCKPLVERKVQFLR